MIEQVYETVCTTNDALIKSKEKIETQIFFIKGEQSKAHPVKLTMKNKDAIQELVKSMALKEGVDGYILVIDARLRFVKEVGTKRTFIKHDKDCVIRTLITPKKKITELVAYKDGVIIDKKRLIGRKETKDAWDAWNEIE